jgi:hypothetical protein
MQNWARPMMRTSFDGRRRCWASAWHQRRALRRPKAAHREMRGGRVDQHPVMSGLFQDRSARNGETAGPRSHQPQGRRMQEAGRLASVPSSRSSRRSRRERLPRWTLVAGIPTRRRSCVPDRTDRKRRRCTVRQSDAGIRRSDTRPRARLVREVQHQCAAAALCLDHLSLAPCSREIVSVD